MAYQEPLASTTRPGIVQVGSGLSITTKGVLSASSSTSGDIGYFYDTTTQINPVAGDPNIINFNTSSISQGISIVDGNKLTVSRSGNYNLQFTLQLNKTDSGTDSVSVWLRRNGNNVTDSKTILSLPFNNAVLLAGWTFLIDLNAGDFLQLIWLSPDAAMRIFFTPEIIGPPAQPGCPSATVIMIQE